MTGRFYVATQHAQLTIFKRQADNWIVKGVRTEIGGWRDVSAVKRACGSCQGPWFRQ